MTDRGDIICEQAYAQGKMLNHSGWNGRLPRGITPSDVDMLLDDDGVILFIEISSQHKDWMELEIGQRKCYQNIVRGNQEHMAALVTHSVPVSEKIDTSRDFETVQCLLWTPDGFMLSEVKELNAAIWKKFVVQWFDLEKRKQLRTKICKKPKKIISLSDNPLED